VLKYSNISILLSIAVCIIALYLMRILNTFIDNEILVSILSVVICLLAICSSNIIYTTILRFRKKQINLLKQKGKLIKAKFIKVTERKSVVLHKRRSLTYRNNRRYQYTVHCEAVNPTNGELMTFKSEDLNFDLTGNIQGTVDVYVDLNNPKKYYVDVEQIVEEMQRQHDNGISNYWQQYKEYKQNKILINIKNKNLKRS